MSVPEKSFLHKKRERGSSLVEIVVGAAIIVLIVFSLAGGYLLFFQTGLGDASRLQAGLYAEEGIEALKYLRDIGWTANILPLSTSATYYLVANGSAWQISTTPSTLPGGFVRTVTAAAVNRDASGAIVASGGTPNSGSRFITLTVFWPTQTGTTSRYLSTYLMNLLGN